MVTIKIGTTADDPKVVNKTLNLGKKEINCRIKGDCNIESPTFILNANTNYINSNYLYCSTWEKYYFITKPPTVGEAGTMEITCEEDVLMTYKDDILSSDQLVVRQEFDYDDSLPDNMIPITSKPQIIVKSFGEDFKSTEHFILGVI